MSDSVMHPTTRRELLATFLGLPVALASGCTRRPGLPPGEIVGASLNLGHRLRQPPPAPTSWQDVPVVIVGAGVAGLAAAWRLHRQKFTRFVLLELEPALGGTSRAGSRGIAPHPWGAHYLPAPMKENRDLLTLLGEMDIVEGTDTEGQPLFAEHILCRDPHERLWHRGTWHEGMYLAAGASAEDHRQHRAFFREIDRLVAWRDGKGRRAFAVPRQMCSDDPRVTRLDRQSMAEWLDRRNLTSSRLRWLVDYGCRDDYGAKPEDVSAWAGLFYFAARRKKPGDASQPLLTWPEGNGRLVAQLASRVKQQIRLDVAVADINPTPRDVEVTAYAGERVVGYRARKVIFAAPRFLLRYIIRPWRQAPPGYLSAFDHGAWMVANLHLRDRPREMQLPLAWDNVLYESRSLGYVVATHQQGRDHGPTIFTYYYPQTHTSTLAGRRELMQLSRDEWAELVLSDLEAAHPDLRPLVERLDVMLWGHAMIRPKPGFIWGEDLKQARKPFRGIHFAHSDLSGLALFEEAFAQGLRAADEVLRSGIQEQV